MYKCKILTLKSLQLELNVLQTFTLLTRNDNDIETRVTVFLTEKYEKLLPLNITCSGLV